MIKAYIWNRIQYYYTINNIHDNGINNISELNLSHDTLNLSKHTKDVNYDYSPIMHGYMSTSRCRGMFGFC